MMNNFKEKFAKLYYEATDSVQPIRNNNVSNSSVVPKSSMSVHPHVTPVFTSVPPNMPPPSPIASVQLSTYPYHTSTSTVPFLPAAEDFVTWSEYQSLVMQFEKERREKEEYMKLVIELEKEIIALKNQLHEVRSGPAIVLSESDKSQSKPMSETPSSGDSDAIISEQEMDLENKFLCLTKKKDVISIESDASDVDMEQDSQSGSNSPQTPEDLREEEEENEMEEEEEKPRDIPTRSKPATRKIITRRYSQETQIQQAPKASRLGKKPRRIKPTIVTAPSEPAAKRPRRSKSDKVGKTKRGRSSSPRKKSSQQQSTLLFTKNVKETRVVSSSPELPVANTGQLSQSVRTVVDSPEIPDDILQPVSMESSNISSTKQPSSDELMSVFD